MKEINYSRRHDLICLIIIGVSFFLLAVFHLQNEDLSFKNVLVGIDDWNKYARYAVDIVENGWEIPSLKENYVYPAGFLYNYFLAACFMIFGYNLAGVYIIQSILLGVSITMVYFSFRSYFSLKTGYLFLGSLWFFAFFDVFRNYSFRLLSENLVIFTLAMFFFFLKRWIEKKDIISVVFTSIFLALSLLTRPNILPFFLLFLIVILMLVQRKYFSIKSMIVFIGFSFVISSSILLRNYVALDTVKLLPTDGNFVDYFFNFNPHNIEEETFSFWVYYFKKILFMIGYLPILDESFKIRPHWFLMYLGFVLFLVGWIKHHIILHLTEKIILVFIFTFLGMLLLIGQVQIYGFRLLFPVHLWILPFSFMGFLVTFKEYKKK